MTLLSLSLGTHDTSQLFLWVIRWAGKTIAGGFSVIEDITICVSSLAWYGVWVSINTLKRCTMVLTIV